MSDRTTCTGTTKAGNPCTAPATVSGYCPWHSPAYTPAERRAWTQRGAAATNLKAIAKTEKRLQEVQAALNELPDLSDAAAVERFVTQMIAQVSTGVLPPAVSNAIRGLLDIRLKLVELGISKKLADLEAELRGVRR
jgi:chaperonin cofactor prefoldin